MMTQFWLCFVPLFVAVDAIGTLPMFLGLTEGVNRNRINRVIVQSVATAMTVALIFLAIGQMILKFLGITIADFMVAGGALLFVLSLSDILSAEKQQRHVDPEDLGVVPLGVPLIVGPAVLTTSILLLREYGFFPTVAALVANISIAGLVFWLSTPISRLLGKTGSKILSKISNLLLAAIAVMMVRRGIVMFIKPDGS
jgi:multiple antibiotic resistance protein